MPHVDMSADHDDIDYSSFDYQQILFQHEESGDNSARSTFTGGVEPLQTRGGLDVNEVAELVQMGVEVIVQTDDHETLSVTEEGVAEFRGSIGANLDSLSDILGVGETAEDRFETPLESNDGSSGQLRTYATDKSEIFHQFQSVTSTPFSSDAGSLGGGGGYYGSVQTVNFRESHGRGPVLDASDEISVVSRLIKNNVMADCEGILRLNCVWDTAEVEEAGRRFSVPMDD